MLRHNLISSAQWPVKSRKKVRLLGLIAMRFLRKKIAFKIKHLATKHSALSH